jgi:hypothetical protein
MRRQCFFSVVMASAVISVHLMASVSHAASARVDLKTVDWAAIIAAEPRLRHPDAPQLDSVRGPYVEGADNAYGYALVDAVEYGDISGDGRDEAMIQLYSGGTAGNTGLLVFADGGAAPRFIGALSGYKMFGRAEGGRLQVQQTAYAGWEPNCCPSGISTTLYRLAGGRLNRQSTRSEGYAEAQAMTVEHFYGLLNAREYADAYRLLGRKFALRQPFARWRAGYNKTTSIAVDAVAQVSANSVIALVTATESGLPARYAVTWQLAWSGRAWLLDAPAVTVLQPDSGVITGRLSFPSEGIPAQDVFAKDTATGKTYQTSTSRGQSSYLLIVPPGTYQVFAYPAGDALFGAAHTRFVTCGGGAQCADHALTPVALTAGAIAGDIDVTDWYAPPGVVPGRP